MYKYIYVYVYMCIQGVLKNVYTLKIIVNVEFNQNFIFQKCKNSDFCRLCSVDFVFQVSLLEKI